MLITTFKYPVKLTDKLNGYEPFIGGSNPSQGTNTEKWAIVGNSHHLSP